MTAETEPALPHAYRDPGSLTPALPGILVAEIESAAAYAKASRASSTQRLYASDWWIFLAWCDARSIEALPADPRAVATFLAAEADNGAKACDDRSPVGGDRLPSQAGRVAATAGA